MLQLQGVLYFSTAKKTITSIRLAGLVYCIPTLCSYSYRRTWLTVKKSWMTKAYLQFFLEWSNRVQLFRLWCRPRTWLRLEHHIFDGSQQSSWKFQQPQSIKINMKGCRIPFLVVYEQTMSESLLLNPFEGFVRHGGKRTGHLLSWRQML